MERAKDQDPRIRDAQATDLPAVQCIYANHVRFGLASFEEEAPDLAEIDRRFRRVTERGLPFLVAELDGEVGVTPTPAPTGLGLLTVTRSKIRSM